MKNTDNLSTTHFQIFDYWKDKHIYSDGTVRSTYNSNSLRIVTDWGEPMCWGCGEPIIGNYEKEKHEEIDFKLLWNDRIVKSKLNRCHIVPRSLGGGVEPSNLFLMCESCHKEAPDTTNKMAFFRWIYQRRNKEYCMGFCHPERMWKEVDEELKRRNLPCLMSILKNIPQAEQKDVETILTDVDELKKYSQDNLGIHCLSISHYGSIVVLTDYLVSKLQKYID